MIALFIAAAAAASARQPEEPLDKTRQKNAIPFVLSRNKTILSARVGKSRPLKIILDSGMGWDGMLVFHPGLRDSLGLVAPQNASLGGAGRGNTQATQFSDGMSFSIGNVEFKNQRVVVFQNDSFKGFPNDGVVGYSLFGHFALEIDYDRSLLVLHDPGAFIPGRSWAEVPLYFKGSKIPWLNARIAIASEEPVEVSCYIDYASSEAIELLLKPGQKFTTPESAKEVVLGRGLSGDITGKIGNIAKVIIGPYEIKNVPAAFASAEVRSKQQGADGVIANNLLRRFNLVFDYANKKLYMRPNSHFNEPF